MSVKSINKFQNSEKHSIDKLSKHSSKDSKNLYKQLFKIACYYHPGRTITNFCTDPKCLMPLCPLCIEIHQHQQQGRLHLANYEPLDIAYNQARTVNKQLRKEQDACEDQMKDLSNIFKKSEADILEMLKEKEKQVVDIVHDAFNKIKKQIKQQFSDYSDTDIEKEIKHAEDEIKKLKKHLNKQKNQLKETKKILPQLINIYEIGYVPSIRQKVQSIQSRLSILQQKIPQIQVNDLVLSTLQSNLLQLVSFRNHSLGHASPLFGKNYNVQMPSMGRSYQQQQQTLVTQAPHLNLETQSYLNQRNFPSTLQSSRIPIVPTMPTMMNIPNFSQKLQPNLMRNSLTFI